MKKLMIGLVVLLGLLAAFIGFFISEIDSIVKEAVERGGQHATGAVTKLEKADVDLGQGYGQLSGLTMGPLAGYKGDPMLTFGSIAVELNLDETDQTHIVVDHVLIRNVEILYEIENGKSNINTLEEKVQNLVTSGSSSTGLTRKNPEILIKKLTMEDIQLYFLNDLTGNRQKVTDIGSLSFENIGGNGKRSDQVAAEVTLAITGAIVKAIATLPFNILPEGMQTILSKPVEIITDGLDSVTDTDAIKDTIKDASNALDNLFNGN